MDRHKAHFSGYLRGLCGIRTFSKTPTIFWMIAIDQVLQMVLNILSGGCGIFAGHLVISILCQKTV